MVDHMKRKTINFILLLICFSILFSGCSSLRRPVTLSPTSYDAAMNILDITDQYLDGKITAVYAAGQTQNLCSILETLPETAGTQESSVKNYSELIAHMLMQLAEGDSVEISELIQTRNYLATLLGERTIIQK